MSLFNDFDEFTVYYQTERKFEKIIFQELCPPFKFEIMIDIHIKKKIDLSTFFVKILSRKYFHYFKLLTLTCNNIAQKRVIMRLKIITNKLN
jgi:hypothetical protein